ncbi:hypothetical protein [Undibacterium sp. SXout20W]|uniref:hypothetical protein n=1 Tax=Undibacterium sp. SXout20W TaxID=3413051 RepID=UPI003BF51A6A
MMSKIEELELQAYKNNITSDVAALLDKYRAIFTWNIPEVDIHYVEKLVLDEIAKTVEQLTSDLKHDE